MLCVFNIYICIYSIADDAIGLLLSRVPWLLFLSTAAREEAGAASEFHARRFPAIMYTTRHEDTQQRDDGESRCHRRCIIL